MPWSGAGTYNLPPAYSPEVNGTTIDAVRYNGLTSDVATGITAALAKNGENVPTANLPMGGFKHTGVADGAAVGQYAVFGQSIQFSQVNVLGSTVAANGIYLPAVNTLGFASNGVARGSINASGNWTLVAPSSAATLDVLGIANQTILQVRDGTRTLALGTDTVNGTVFVGASSGHGTDLYSNGVRRVSVGTAGNVVVSAPGSGIALSVNRAIAGSVTGGPLQFPNDSIVSWLDSGGATTSCGFIWFNSSNALCLGAGNGVRVTVNSDGRCVFNTTSAAANFHELQSNSVLIGYLGDRAGVIGSGSGVALQSQNDLTLSAGGAVALLTVASDGRVYGNKLHNTGTVTGTTNQYIASGTYTPTLTNTTNISSSTSASIQWIRVGNVVHVAGRVNVNCTSGGSTTTELGMSVPIASTLGATNNLGGTGVSPLTQTNGIQIGADTANNRAKLVSICSLSGASDWYFSFSYVIL